MCNPTSITAVLFMTGNLTTFDSKRIERAQNRAARLITGTIRRTPIDGLMKELGWSSVADRRRKNRLFLLHKLTYDPAVPRFIKDIVPKTRASVVGRQLRMSQKPEHLLWVGSCETQTTLSHSPPHEQLPIPIRSSPAPHAFGANYQLNTASRTAIRLSKNIFRD